MTSLPQSKKIAEIFNRAQGKKYTAAAKGLISDMFTSFKTKNALTDKQVTVLESTVDNYLIAFDPLSFNLKTEDEKSKEFVESCSKYFATHGGISFKQHKKLEAMKEAQTRFA